MLVVLKIAIPLPFFIYYLLKCYHVVRLKKYFLSETLCLQNEAVNLLIERVNIPFGVNGLLL